jgi:hypothetical protein
MARTAAAARTGEVDDYQLPDEAESLDGSSYDPREDHWLLHTLTGDHHFDFCDLKTRGLSPALITPFKGVVSARMRVHSTRSVVTFHAGLRDVLRHIANRYPGAVAITKAHLASFRDSLSAASLYKSTVTNIWIVYWANLGIPGVAEDAVAYAIEAEKHHTRRGHAVRTRCPIHGPYTSLEFDGLHKALHAAFGSGQISFYNYLVSVLSGTIAPRPEQIALLKTCDLQISRQDYGSERYVLSVPRVKQRCQTARTEFMDRELIEEIGLLMARHAKRIRERAEAAGLDPEQVPLFPKACRGRNVTDPMEHTTSSNIGRRIAHTLENLDVKSERTGETINATATRSRRTLGTRMAQEGSPAAVIADALDHTGIGSVMIYVETRAEMLRRLDEKVAVHMAPMAQRFVGKIVRRDRDVEHSDERHVFGVVQEGEGPKDIGGCGKHSFCGLAKPVACYTCVQFQPWEDGPHEEILRGLLAKRERQAESGSLRVAESLDDTILAAAWVVQKCREKQAALEDAVNG